MSKDFTRLDNLLKDFVDRKTIPGCGCAIMQGDEVIYEGYAGWANIEEKKPIDKHSMFR